MVAKKEFVPLLLGNDVNSYCLARSFHESYDIGSLAIGKSNAGPNCNSRLIDYKCIPDIDNEELFVSRINKIAAKNNNRLILLLGCGDDYLVLIARNKYAFYENVVAPYVDYDKMLKLINKENFYFLCRDAGIECAKTYIHKKGMSRDVALDFDFPAVVKPAVSAAYWRHPFEGQQKVFRVGSSAQLSSLLDRIYLSGYDDSLIIQEFIPGDDTNMRTITCYSDQSGEVRLAALGHVLLEEHTPRGLGNYAVILNDVEPKLVNKLIIFLNSIKFAGFSNTDVKYDSRDGRYKFLEVNTRQGRGHYHITAAGYPIVEFLVDDVIYGKKREFVMAENEYLMSLIPLNLALANVRQETLKAKMRRLIADNKFVNPLFNEKDASLKRTLFVLRNYYSHYWKYHRYKGIAES